MNVAAHQNVRFTLFQLIRLVRQHKNRLQRLGLDIVRTQRRIKTIRLRLGRLGIGGVVLLPELWIFQMQIEQLAFGEEGLKAVIVALGDGIELVIVALCAAEGQAEQCGGRRVGDVELHIHALAVQVILVATVAGRGEKAGGDEIVVGIGSDFIPGHLLADELIERLVVVERFDDPIAITPREWPRIVHLIAFGVGVARDVKPVPAPALAIMRRGEEAVDQFLIGIG